MSDTYAELRFAKPSLRMRLGEWIVSKQPSGFGDAEAIRTGVPKRVLPKDAPMPDKFHRKFTVENWEAEGQKVVTVHPKTGKGEWHIIYFHGGGYFMPIFKEHWPLVEAMVYATGASITVPLYDVIPESTYHRANDQADAVYEKIAAEWGDDKLALCGDSAGGNMTLALALQRRDAGKSLPARLIPFSPWFDMAMKDPAAQDIQEKDIMLNIEAIRVLGEWWAGDRGVDNPIASPLYADLKGLPPIAIFQGRHDVFLPDARTFAAKAQEAGVPTKLYEYEGGPHVYMALTFTRESKDTVRLVKDFLDNG
ncbi:alpha/beta hydrolase [Pontixanthobacter aestiaquae]|uniref:Alpha/beta hydrolase fold domain-containing protein n=1 Tax=Pontixanthobacter aestiaquae TaxID=1509367 RepID=A0A844Z480_9SPHN|nr:alpha/beta hydrolase [Pontixanthobacter aestiaquae]MDN3646484.1 alpha/beta hydrolase [Pontixanthobacter aestiaquae]MXO82528.1 alpha/beta hydrolase fold domain-containing protein [Pontixanthobacter aestiaquae]